MDKPTAFFFRDGRPVPEDKLAQIKHGKRKDSGFIPETGPCSRCGGQGGAQAWAYTGFTCYRCGGHNSMHFEHYNRKVYTAERLATLNAIAERKAAKKRAEREAAEAKARAEFITWAKTGGHGPLIGRILREDAPDPGSFFGSLAAQLHSKRTLSEKQLAAAQSIFDKRDKRKAQDAASSHVGALKERISFEGVVEFETVRDGYYGATHILKFRDDSGNVFTWFASGARTLEKGDRVKVTGTVKKHDEYQGVKQTVLTRCKVEKFATLAPGAAAALERIEDQPHLNEISDAISVHLIYPERRTVTGTQILMWHDDAVANGELTESTRSLKKAIADLEDLGHITAAQEAMSA